MKTKKQNNNFQSKFNAFFHKKDGASLVELMLAIAIFVIAGASIAHLFIGAQTASEYGVSKTQALLLAREKIEDTRETRDVDGFDSLASGTTTETVVLGDRSYDTSVVLDCSGEVCEVTSSVSWTIREKEETASFVEHLTDWYQEEPAE
jgi:type II secretory pathway pseudopilin PulG